MSHPVAAVRARTMRLWTHALAAVCLLWLWAASAWPQVPSAWTYSGSDVKEATKSLQTFLKAHGVEIVKTFGDTTMIKGSLYRVGLRPKVGKEGLDRLVVVIALLVKDSQKKNKAALTELANTLNTKYDVGSFYYTEATGDIFYIGQITFINTLTWQELQEALSFYQKAVWYIAHLPMCAKYLK